MDLFRKWFDVIRQQAFTRANIDPDLCCHMTSLGHNELRDTVGENGFAAISQDLLEIQTDLGP